jgi:inactivated superfamily I helicase
VTVGKNGFLSSPVCAFEIAFVSTSVELDAIAPQRLRDLVRDMIEQHLPRRQFDILKAAEERERAALMALAKKVKG